MPDKHVLTGCLDNQDKNILFFNDGYTFTFMSDKAVFSPSNYLSFKTQDGFLHGTTHTGKKVAIMTGAFELPLPLNKVILPISLYFESVQDRDVTYTIQRFNRIRFQGGVLNTLGFALVDMKVLDDQRKQLFATPDEKCTIYTGYLNHKTCKLLLTQEEKVFVLDLFFEKEQPLSSFRLHYDHVKKLLSFMTHRTENRIDSIWVSNGSFDEDRVIVHVADNDKNSLDDSLLPIVFPELGDKIGALLELFYNSTEDKPSYSLDFIPRSNSERWTITNDTVRSVFSALECENNANDYIKKPQEKALQELRRTVKKTVREYRKANKGKNELSNDTYNSISSDIDNWAMPAKERIMAMVEEHRDALKAFLGGEIKVTDKEVQAFVKYRNSITHGNYRKITTSIQRTTRAMKALVYCSLLQRIVVTKEKIVEISSKLRF